jgi:hypothetical protein
MKAPERPTPRKIKLLLVCHYASLHRDAQIIEGYKLTRKLTSSMLAFPGSWKDAEVLTFRRCYDEVL